MTTAIKWLAEATRPGETALLVVRALQNAEEQSVIGEVIGADAAKALGAGKPVRLGKGSLRLVTIKREKPTPWAGGPVLVAWATQDLVDLADGYDRATAVLAVAWGNDDELKNWVRTWNVPRLGETAPPPEPLVRNPVVLRALEDVIPSVNIADGGTHPSDHASIVHMFRVLQKNGEAYDPDEIRNWLVAELKMHSLHAENIKKIAAKIRAGRSVRTRDPFKRSSTDIQRWRSKR